MVAAMDVTAIAERLMFIEEALRQDYEILIKEEDVEPVERFFLNVGGDIQEVSREQYEAHQESTQD